MHSTRLFPQFNSACLPDRIGLAVSNYITHFPINLDLQALVIRSRAVSLGPDHVDTQLIYHNLGCVLDQLGKGQKALELYERAYKVCVQLPVTALSVQIWLRCRLGS